MTGVVLSLLLQTTWATTGADTYAEAYAKMEATGQPMLVVVGADWCPACVQMKRGTIPAMIRGGQLDNVSVAFVNSDREPELARQLMRGNTIPQTLIFRNTTGGWHRRQVTGRASSGSVMALVNEALRLEGVKSMATTTTTADESSTARQ